MWTIEEVILAIIVLIVLYAWLTTAWMRGFYSLLWRALTTPLVFVWDRGLKIISPEPRADYVTQFEKPLPGGFDTDTDTTAVIPPLVPTDEQIVTYLAKRKSPDGKPFSANAIFAIVGGNRNQVLAWVKAARPASVEEQPLHVTPIVGRPTAARFSADDLEYEQPPQGR